jgi:hypothetical protein
MFAPATVPRRKIRKGTSGATARCSMITNAPSSAAAAAKTPSVRAEAQPLDSASTIAYTAAVSPVVTVAAPGSSKLRCATAARLSGDQPERQEGRDDPDRDIDEQDPLPAQRVGDDAAEQDADGSARPGHGAPDPEGLVALGARREDRGEDRQRGGREQRPAQSLNSAGGNQLRRGLGESAGE